MLEKLKKKGKLWIIILGAVAGVFLLLIGNGTSEQKQVEANEAKALEEYSQSVEKKIHEICSKVKGVSDVSVAVSFESGFEYVYAREDGGDVVVVGSGSSKSPIRVKEKMPVIGGIGIVCKGGGDPTVQKKLLDLISAAFGVSSSKIYIAEAKK